MIALLRLKMERLLKNNQKHDIILVIINLMLTYRHNGEKWSRIMKSATEIWNEYVSIRGYKEPDGNLEDDAFFNDGRICKKYDDWDSENLCRKYAKTNTELRELLDAEDTKKYSEYMEMYMDTPIQLQFICMVVRLMIQQRHKGLYTQILVLILVVDV